MKPLAVDLDRRDHRRHLHQIPGEAVGSSTHLIVGDRRHVVGGGDLAGSVEGRRLRPEHDLTLVALRQLGEKPQQAGGVSHAEHQHTGCVGVKRARVTDLPSADHTAGLGDDIVAGPARRLVDHDDTVWAGATRLRAHPQPRSQHRSRDRAPVGARPPDAGSPRCAADRSVESERNSSSARDAAACPGSPRAQSAAILLERFVDLGITVTVEGREVDHRLVEITVDVDTRERHEFESFILDVLEFGRDDPTDQLACFGCARARSAGSVVPAAALAHQLSRSSRVRSISRSS